MKENEEDTMPPPKKKKMNIERSPNDIVSFDLFKKLIQNLPDICVEVQRDGVAKTLDDCARWYYESFYTDPEVRQKYPYKLRACPMKIRDKLLRMPETADGVRVRVARMGTFSFPVSFFTFKNCVNVKQVLRLIAMNKEERQALLANEDQCLVVLRKFYNSFYVFPDRRSTNIFKDTSPLLLSQLLEPGKPLDEMAIKSLADYMADKQSPSIASFKEFKEHLANIYDLSWQLKRHDSQYISLGFEKCAQALYLTFYLTPEIRDKFTFKWRPCGTAMMERLLTIPSEEAAEELRQNMSELETKDKQTLEVDGASSKPRSAADNPRKTLEKEENQDKIPKAPEPPKEHVMISDDISRLFLEGSFQDSEEELFQTDVEVDIGRLGRFMYPVSFDTFRRCINYPEIIRPVLKLVTQTESELAALIAHPFSPLCERTFRRYYRSFYILPDIRQRFPYRFSSSDPQVLKKLTEYAKPIDERAIKALEEATVRSKEAIHAVPAPQSKNGQAKEDKTVKASTVEAQESQNSDDLEMEVGGNRENKKQPKKTPSLPVSFCVFKRYVRNLNEILQQMQLFDEYMEKSDAECAQEYYEGFYTSPEIRKRFLCKFRPCPAKMRDRLLSYAQKPLLAYYSQESDVDVEAISDVEVDICNNILENGSKENTALTKMSEEPKSIKSEGGKDVTYPVSFQVFRGSLGNLEEIVRQMLKCDDYKGKSEVECAQDYYNGFYSSKEMRDRFPFQLKPCPAKMRKILISFPTTERREHLTSPGKHAEEGASACSAEKIGKNIAVTEVDSVKTLSIETPGSTKESMPQNQASINSQQLAASLNQGSR